MAVLCQVQAQNAASLFAQGNKAYQQENYAQAANHYEAILAGGVESAEVYYNLGNCYYREGELGKSLLNYERAKRLAPNDNEIQENLDFVYSKTDDHIKVMPQIFFVRWCHNLNGALPLRGWINFCIIMMVLTCASVIVFALSREYQWRKSSLIVSFIMIFLLLLTGTNAAFSAHTSSNDNEAIVMSPISVAKSSPDNNSVDKFVLHEGTKVRVDDAVDGWTKIRIADGTRGWIATADITVI